MNDFTVLVLAGASASAVAVTLDLLSAAATVAPRVGAPVPRWRVLCVGADETPLSNGFTVRGKALPRRPRADNSLWIIPGMQLPGEKELAARFVQPDALHAMAALRTQARAGGVLAASCSSVFLLQEAGLVRGKRVTTAWWMAALLHRREPACTVDADRMVIEDGAIITAGAALAQTDLMLHLLRRRFGHRLADTVASVLLIDARQAQAPFVVPAMMATGNALVAQITAHIETALPRMPTIAELAAQFCMSERTLARHLRTATGRSPLTLLQSVRMNRARTLLENSKLSVDEIAAQVGYGDATALRRLMRRTTGATPRQFRKH